MSSPDRERPILLISCYELGHQPLALASTLGFLEREGISAVAVDVSLDPLPKEIAADAPLVAIAVPMHTAARLGIAVAARVRELNPTAHICFFGLYATLNREWLLETAADSVLGGEYEEALVTLAQRVTAGKPGIDRSPERPVLERLNFPVPRRDGLPPLERYAPLIDGDRRRTAGYIEASRGCLHVCRHCPIVPVYDGRLFVVPPEVVLADASQQIEAGATHLTFGDPDFFNGPGHTMAIARQLHREHPSVTFDATTKIENILKHERLVAELPELGFGFLVSAVESLSDEVLLKLDKGHVRADVDLALAALDAIGLPMRPTFVPFTPWTSLADYVAVLDWIGDHDLEDSVDPIQMAIRLLVPPGSRLLELGAEPGWPDDCWPGPLESAALSHRWRHPDERMDSLQRQVTAHVESHAREARAARDTYDGIRRLARTAAGHHADVGDDPLPGPPLVGPRRDRPPRLAEAWFC